MTKCTFCGEKIEKGTGKMFVRTDGKVLHFCSNKCEKKMLQQHKSPRDVKWTSTARKLKGGG